MPDEETKIGDVDATSTADDDTKDDDALEAALTPDDDDKPADDDAEYYDSDEEFLKSYHEKGLPDTIKSVEDAMDFALNVSEQAKSGGDDRNKMDRLNQFLAQQGIVGGIDALLAGGQLPSSKPPSGDEEKEIIPSTPAMDFVDKALRDRRIKADDEGFFRHQAEMTDAALKTVLQPVKQALGLYATMLKSHGGIIKEMEWQTMPRRYKDSVKRHELDSLINAHRAGSYMDAFKMLAFSDRPDLIRVMADDGGKSHARTPAINKHRRRPIKKPDDFSRYLNEDGTVNQTELAKLDGEKRLKVLRGMEKHFKE